MNDTRFVEWKHSKTKSGCLHLRCMHMMSNSGLMKLSEFANWVSTVGENINVIEKQAAEHLGCK